MIKVGEEGLNKSCIKVLIVHDIEEKYLGFPFKMKKKYGQYPHPFLKVPLGVGVQVIKIFFLRFLFSNIPQSGLITKHKKKYKGGNWKKKRERKVESERKS